MIRTCSITILALLALTGVPCVRADTLEEDERAQLRRYLADLKKGVPGSAVQVDRLYEGINPEFLAPRPPRADDPAR